MTQKTSVRSAADDFSAARTGRPSPSLYGAIRTYNGGDISWSLPNTTFETDLSDFSISGGILSFRSSPDHESPHDSNRDNVYKVTVRASDPNGGTADRNVTITVPDVNERPVVDSQILNQRLTVGSNRGFLCCVGWRVALRDSTWNSTPTCPGSP